jgi:hypothetical protein
VKNKIISGIAAYKREQDVFLRILKKRGQFTASEFDKWFKRREWRRPLRKKQIQADTLILGWSGGTWSYWAEMLELLQFMIRLELVEVRTVNSEITYFLPSGSTKDGVKV